MGRLHCFPLSFSFDASHMEKYVVVGKLGKVHGLGGFLRLRLDVPHYIDDIRAGGVLFVGDEKAPLPYFIATIKGDAPDWLIQFEDVTAREAAEQMAGQTLYLRESDVSTPLPENPAQDQSGLKGYTIIDITLGDIGVIEQIVEYPQQWMAVLQKEGREILIPLHEQLVQEVDEEKQVIHMDLPEGLLEL